MELKKLFREASKSRTFVALWILNLAQAITLAILVLVNTHSGLTLQTHCDIGGSVPDCTSAEAAWYYLYNIAIFAIIMLALNALVSLKLFSLKGRQVALTWLWLTTIILLIVTALLVTFAHYALRTK